MAAEFCAPPDYLAGFKGRVPEKGKRNEEAKEMKGGRADGHPNF